MTFNFIPEKPLSTTISGNSDEKTLCQQMKTLCQQMKTTFIFDTENNEFDISSIKFELVNSNVPITVLYNHLDEITIHLNDLEYQIKYPLTLKTDTPFAFVKMKFKGVIKLEIVFKDKEFKLYRDMKITLQKMKLEETTLENENEIEEIKHFKQFRLSLYPFNLQSILELPISDKKRLITIVKSDDYVNITTFTNSNPIPNFNKEGDYCEILPFSNYLIITDTYSYNPGMKQKYIYFNVEY